MKPDENSGEGTCARFLCGMTVGLVCMCCGLYMHVHGQAGGGIPGQEITVSFVWLKVAFGNRETRDQTADTGVLLGCAPDERDTRIRTCSFLSFLSSRQS